MRRAFQQQRFLQTDAEARVQAAILAPLGDCSSQHGAERLKAKIEAAWRKRGLEPPAIEIVRRVIIVGRDEIERFELFSKMKNGLPEGARA